MAYAEREIQMKRKSFAYALGMCMLPTELCISTYTEEKIFILRITNRRNENFTGKAIYYVTM